MNDKLLTQAEVADILRLDGEVTLRQWRSQKVGPPYIKVGSRVRYSERALVEWIEERTTKHE